MGLFAGSAIVHDSRKLIVAVSRDDEVHTSLAVVIPTESKARSRTTVDFDDTTLAEVDLAIILILVRG
jgi:hypothetical protein